MTRHADRPYPSPMPWSVDIKGRTATNDAGVVIKFIRSNETEWAGRVIAGLDRVAPQDAARLMREAGEAFSRALAESASS